MAENATKRFLESRMTQMWEELWIVFCLMNSGRSSVVTLSPLSDVEKLEPNLSLISQQRWYFFRIKGTRCQCWVATYFRWLPKDNLWRCMGQPHWGFEKLKLRNMHCCPKLYKPIPFPTNALGSNDEDLAELAVDICVRRLHNERAEGKFLMDDALIIRLLSCYLPSIRLGPRHKALQILRYIMSIPN